MKCQVTQGKSGLCMRKSKFSISARIGKSKMPPKPTRFQMAPQTGWNATLPYKALWCPSPWHCGIEKWDFPPYFSQHTHARRKAFHELIKPIGLGVHFSEHLHLLILAPGRYISGHLRYTHDRRYCLNMRAILLKKDQPAPRSSPTPDALQRYHDTVLLVWLSR